MCGVGINDSDYVVQVKKDVQNNSGVRKQKVVWNCPFYQSWSGMLKRCYSEKRLKETQPTSVVVFLKNGRYLPTSELGW